MHETVRSSSLPFLKWTGGKRWLAPGINTLVNNGDSRARIVEPFLGGGAFFFASSERPGLLADTNADLIGTFRAVQTEVAQVLQRLRALPAPSRESFERVAKSKPRSSSSRAARFIYLNRLAFNGIWRVNALGAFNVPYGDRPPIDLVREAQLRSCSERLQLADLREACFSQTLRDVTEGDFIYCDPPYTVSHNNNGFIRYNETLFRWADQERLATSLRRLADKGVPVAVSNAAHQDVLGLYPRKEFDAFAIVRVSRVAGDVTHRRPQSEMLFLSKSIGVSRRRAVSELQETLPRAVTIENVR